jgi:uncharacterized protein involved in oxidation of intracellular sulfur
MNALIIINDAPYGTEKAFNALRLAMTLQGEGADVNIFLLADAVTCALPNQVTPQGYYNITSMLKGIIAKGGQVKVCGRCAIARGIKELKLIDGAEISSMMELTRWVIDSDKVITF